jgi:hypothetical protein
VDFNTPVKFFKNRQGLTKVYFPNSFEGESSPGEFPPGPIDFHPRQFLITYPEANRIYAKMMTTHMLINQLRGDKSRKRSARDALWKAQGCDSFYRTMGGGIYRNTVRNAAYRALLEAERITREKGVFIPSVMPVDFDLDGEEEYLFQDERINCYVKTLGASVFELDFLPKTWNYLDTLLPRTGSAGDKLPRGFRNAFADYLLPPDFPPALLADPAPESVAGSFPGRCCGAENYEVLEADKAREKAVFRLQANPALPFGSVEIEKTYHLKKDVLSIHYRLTNRGGEPLRFGFVPRLDLSFPGEGEGFLRVLKLGAEAKDALSGAAGEIRDAGGLEFQDLKNEVTIILSADRNFDALILPVKIPCFVYGEELQLYQSTCVIPLSMLSLESEASWEAEYRLKLSQRLRKESGAD